MSNFRGYYMKCNGCEFRNPSLSREGFKFAPRLVQVADATTTADGALTMKVLPHYRSKIWCTFPVMTPEQFRVYYNALKIGEGSPSMYLTIEVYDLATDSYVTDTYYHTDIVYTPIKYKGQEMIRIDSFELIGH